ncbi:tryptophan synthase subunit alpha [Micromonospora craniellae]|uniref:Tryptophan synthase alpha chain n=1 Tax=Micromonospora craniellae TaxID=2294034 RepID=A0A372G2E6_9ACTN|nr:tryptophan synthase subunit alpha [Micromonospora craniellae]QOC89918.1 tryptophan synthase subunit alpha [Micromonospora craniellae]RFS47064.1 tryptophan synthase subunit alpha [Micromonospora craniellae]
MSGKLLVPYVTGGIRPDWTGYVEAYARSGADMIEIGLPFSDPILDGPTIQQASYRALRQGATVRSILDDLTEVDVDVPLIAMTYYNLVMHDPAFCADLAAAGVSGLIVPDVPIDEVDELAASATAAGVDLVLLAAPTTPGPRLAAIARRSRRFVYAVSVMGTTGERDRLADDAVRLARDLRALTDLPVLLGFGISRPAHAVEAAEAADGVVVASALMRMVLDGADPAQVGAVVAEFRAALDGVGVPVPG